MWRHTGRGGTPWEEAGFSFLSEVRSSTVSLVTIVTYAVHTSVLSQVMKL